MEVKNNEEKFDVIIVGAGVIGCSVAYHLAKLGCANVLLLEREDFPGTGSTSKALGGIRAQFSTAINVQMSLLAMKLLEEMEEEMRAQAGYVKAGYLFMTSDKQRFEHMRGAARFQQELGVSVAVLAREEIAACVPFIKTEDLLGGTFGSRDGFIDANGLTNAYFTRACARGVQYLKLVEVQAFIKQNKRTVGVKTTAGDFFAEFVVNCCGPFAQDLARLAGVDLPVEAIRRQVVITGPEHSWPRVLPMLIDSDTGLVMRRDGEAIALIYSNPEEPAGMNLKFDHEYIEIVAQKMLQRAPSLETAGFNHSRCWAGCYEVSPDHHAIIGASGVPGFLLCNGFSGHGVMHAPAAGLALAEMIVQGRPSSIDLAPLALTRFAENRLLHESAVF